MKLVFLTGLFVARLSAQAPNVLFVENAAGPPQNITCNPGCGSLPVAPNTWMSLYGTNLAAVTQAWSASDFVDGRMPTSLTGVSVQLLGDYGSNNVYKAFVSYVSPTQINVLTPANLGANPGDDSTGYGFEVQISNPLTPQAYVSNCSDPYSCPFVEFATAAPQFFMLGSTGYAVAEHADGTLVAPAGAFAGSSPAMEGEIVSIYANGLGPTSGTIMIGSTVQSGMMVSKPAVTIAGTGATVWFAGLISPGLYQLNVAIPRDAPFGNDTMTLSAEAGFDGFMSALPVLIAVGE